MANRTEDEYRLLHTGNQAFAAMLEAIDASQHSIRLEVYIFRKSEIGERFRQALIRAQQRSVRVQILLDAWGSVQLDEDYWAELKAIGGQVHWFNPIALKRFGIRDHRKLLVCDDEVAFIGGFNIAAEYEGDGLNCGWCDMGLQLTGPLVKELADAFDAMVQRADLPHRRFTVLRRSKDSKLVSSQKSSLLLSTPGRGAGRMRRVLQQDFTKARKLQVVAAYFLPPWSMRRALARAARSGGQVQLILPAKSDVTLMQLASQSLYRRLLRAGVEIYEYQPQILHAKLVIADNAVYIGSANLDTRSLHINYELLVRIRSAPLAAEAREHFQKLLTQCRRVERETWRKQRTFFGELKRRWAYWILVRFDPFIARRQMRSLR